MNRERLLACAAATRAAGPHFNMCGWASCAIGNYIAANPECGLELVWTSTGPRVQAIHNPAFHCMDDVAAHFDLLESEARHLFSMNSYEYRQLWNPAAVADRIEAFIAAHSRRWT